MPEGGGILRLCGHLLVSDIRACVGTATPSSRSARSTGTDIGTGTTAHTEDSAPQIRQERDLGGFISASASFCKVRQTTAKRWFSK